MMNSGNTVGGVNEQELDDIVLQLNSDIDSISTILNQIQMEFYDTSSYFKGDVADSFRDKFDFYDKQMNTIKENLKSYSSDLIKVKEMMGQIDVSSSEFLDEKATETDRKTAQTIEKVIQDRDSLYVGLSENISLPSNR